MKRHHRLDVKPLVLASCLLATGWATGCAGDENPASAGTKTPATTGTQVDVNAKTLLEGAWDGDDPGAKAYSWTYLIAGNSISVSKVQGGQTTEYYKGVFTLDSNATPHRIDILITGSPGSLFNGKRVQALYDYIGADGSFELLKVSNTEPDAPRPGELSGAVAIVFYKRGIGL